MKLLFDQNLSPRLPRLLEDLYPDSAHIRELGMRDATDTQIWEYARANGFAIVSKDSDFQAAQPASRTSSQVHLAASGELSGEHY
jgi:predicted nuclease of predicted toxin-antitoxin system